jgi:hypothetical protein
MSAVLAVVGWIAWLIVAGYIAVAGVSMAYLTGGFTGRVSRIAVLIGLVGLALVLTALWFAPFSVSWKS